MTGNQVIFVRHAESVANATGSLDCGVPGPSLTPRGLGQAKELVDLLESELDGRRVRAVWASTMLRAQQTAEPVAERWALPLRVHPALREADIGDLHARVDEVAHRSLVELFGHWMLHGDLGRSRPGGETGHGLIDRMRQAVVDILAGTGPEPGVVVVVSHSALLRVALSHLCDGLTPEYAFANELPNTGRVTVDVLDRDHPVLTCRSWDGMPPFRSTTPR